MRGLLTPKAFKAAGKAAGGWRPRHPTAQHRRSWLPGFADGSLVRPRHDHATPGFPVQKCSPLEPPQHNLMVARTLRSLCVPLRCPRQSCCPAGAPLKRLVTPANRRSCTQCGMCRIEYPTLWSISRSVFVMSHLPSGTLPPCSFPNAPRRLDLSTVPSKCS